MAPRIDRPLSPFMTYRWTLTMAMSIVHRATGIALVAGLLGLVYGLVALAAGPERWDAFTACAGSLFGRIVLL